MGDISVNLGAELGAVAGVTTVGQSVMDSAVRAPFGCQVLCFIPQPAADSLSWAGP